MSILTIFKIHHFYKYIYSVGRIEIFCDLAIYKIIAHSFRVTLGNVSRETILKLWKQFFRIGPTRHEVKWDISETEIAERVVSVICILSSIRTIA